MRMNRREFLKLSGTAVGTAASAAAVYTFLPHVAFAGGGEPVFAASVVLQPSFAAPEIVRRGERLRVSVPQGMDLVEEMWLQAAGTTEKVLLGGAEPMKLAGQYLLSVESKIEAGLYDLYAGVARDGKIRVERQPLAVKVVEEFKEDFVFGVISDVHFGDPRISSKLKGFDVGETFRKEINILNERGVEFCLCCGDLCFIPPKTKKEIMEYADALIERAKFPTFLVPGNHDGYASGTPAKVSFDTYKYYRRYFGPLNFESSYGDISIIGVNTYDKSPELRNLYGGLGEDVDTGAIGKEQLEWLNFILPIAREHSKSIIMFGHHNPTNTVKDVNGPFEIVPFSDEGREELLALIKKHEPDAYFCGHVHGIHEETYGKTRIYTAPTAASLPAEGHPVAIQVVKVKGGKIDFVETIEVAKV
ncbi:MAG: metallophosphoesterase [bacterium]